MQIEHTIRSNQAYLYLSRNIDRQRDEGQNVKSIPDKQNEIYKNEKRTIK